MSVGGAAKNSRSFLLQGQEGKTDQHDGYVDGQHQERSQKAEYLLRVRSTRKGRQ
jgi:hypothetical protein